MRSCTLIPDSHWWNSTGTSQQVDSPTLAYITVFLPTLLLALIVLARTISYAAMRVWTWLTKVNHCSSTQRRVAASIEQRGTTKEEVELVDALESEGTVSDEVHTMCAEDAYRERNMRSAKQFYKVWIAAVRLEFPLRSNRPSDRACMTKWLTAKMRATGMRITHMEDCIPRIVAMAINPSRAEVEAEEMGKEADQWRHNHTGLWRWALFGMGSPMAGKDKWE